MRGRTNISGGGGFIDGQLEKYEIADGKTVTKGQFVEFETEPTTKLFTKNPFYDHYARVEKIEDGVFWFLYNPRSSWILSVVDIRNGFVVKDSYVLTPNYSYSSNIILKENGNAIVFDYATGYLKIMSYSEANGIEIASQFYIDGKENSSFYGMTSELDKIILFFKKTENSRYYIEYIVLKISNETIEILKQETLSQTDSSYNSSYIFNKTVNNSIVLIIGKKDVNATNSVKVFDFNYENNTVSSKQESVLQHCHSMISGMDCMTENELSFFVEQNRNLHIYSMQDGLSEINQYRVGSNSGYDPSLTIESIINNQIIFANNNYLPGSSIVYMEFYTASIDKIGNIIPNKKLRLEKSMSDYYYASTGAFFVNNNDIYYVGYDGSNVLVFGLTMLSDGSLEFKGIKKIKPYDTVINGVANQSGTGGDTIEIYVPTTE